MSDNLIHDFKRADEGDAHICLCLKTWLTVPNYEGHTREFLRADRADNLRLRELCSIVLLKEVPSTTIQCRIP